jgi:uncharacterized membrane protein YhfC
VISTTNDIQISGALIGTTIAAILFEILFPLVVAFVVGRKLGVSWRYFGYGALIFFLFQIISRVPIIQVTQALIAPQLRASSMLRFVWITIAAATAGLSEEIGRYIGYRWLMKREEKTWSKAIMYGLGHGGIESMVLVAGLTALSLIQLLALARTDLNTLPISEEQRAQIAQQLAAANAQPAWAGLLGAWERIWSIIFHVALSVMVLQVFRRGSLRWLWLAIVAHAAVDFVAAGLPALLPLGAPTRLLLPEAIIAVVGLISLWVIWRLRDRPNAAEVPGEHVNSEPPRAAPLDQTHE